MLQQLINELRKFDETEDFFGSDFIDNISTSVSSDAYLLKVFDYAPLVLKKDQCFEINYFSMINFLTRVKSWHVNGGEPKQATIYFYDWLTYKCSYNIRKAWFYLTVQDVSNTDEVIEALMDIQGRTNYLAVLAVMNTPNDDYEQHATNIMDYVGNTRAIRDLSMLYLDPVKGIQWQFHLWHMTPAEIIEQFGYVFYLGNELSSFKYCPFDYFAQEYYFSKLYHDIIKNLDKDIPKNRGISEERKKQVRREIESMIHPSDDEVPADEYECFDGGYDGVCEEIIEEDDDIVGWADFEDDSEDFDIEIDDDTATDFGSDSDEDD